MTAAATLRRPADVIPLDYTPRMRRYVESARYRGLWDQMVEAIVWDPEFRKVFQTLSAERQRVAAAMVLDQVIVALLAYACNSGQRIALPPLLNGAWRVMRDFTRWYVEFCHERSGAYLHYDPPTTSRGTNPGRRIAGTVSLIGDHIDLAAVYHPWFWEITQWPDERHDG